MAEKKSCFIFLSLFFVVLSKELHTKPDLATKDKYSQGFMNLFNDENTFDDETNERYARHIKAVTENVLDHILNEIKREYSNTTYNSNSPLQRLMRNLNKELKRNERSKLMKEVEKRKHGKKYSFGKKQLQLTTPKTISYFRDKMWGA